MRAFRPTAPHRTERTTVPQPGPGPGDALVRIGAPGVCHSDLHILDALERGEAVAVYGIVGCGTCAACHAGRDHECRTIGDLDVAQAAPLTDAGHPTR